MAMQIISLYVADVCDAFTGDNTPISTSSSQLLWPQYQLPKATSGLAYGPEFDLEIRVNDQYRRL